jgi:hypothetical protein
MIRARCALMAILGSSPRMTRWMRKVRAMSAVSPMPAMPVRGARDRQAEHFP